MIGQGTWLAFPVCCISQEGWSHSQTLFIPPLTEKDKRRGCYEFVLAPLFIPRSLFFSWVIIAWVSWWWINADLTWFAMPRLLESCWKTIQTQPVSHDTDKFSPLHSAFLFLDFFSLLILSLVRKHCWWRALAACIGYWYTIRSGARQAICLLPLPPKRYWSIIYML